VRLAVVAARPRQDVDDLAQSFFVKVLEKDLLFQARPGCSVPQVALRQLAAPCFRPLPQAGRSREKHQLDVAFGPADAQPVPGWSGHADDPDSLYALSVLNMTLQKMRYPLRDLGQARDLEMLRRAARARVKTKGGRKTADELSALSPTRTRRSSGTGSPPPSGSFSESSAK